MRDPPNPAAVRAPRLGRFVAIAALVAAGLVAWGVITRVRAGQELKSWTREQAVPTVALAEVKGAGDQALTLPGAFEALNSAPIHARISGYLKRWHADIGQPVRAGQLLAEIDTPELDQQVMQARADLATAQANEALARTTAQRWASLLQKDVVSRQAAEEKAGELAARASAANSARANLGRLLEMAKFKRLTAPFDGVVTTRNTDVGALVTVGGPAAAPLFTVVDLRRLRIYVNVPQSYAAQVRPGMSADVVVPEYPDETFAATMVRTSQAIEDSSGTMRVELQLDNADGRLKPGAYAQVSFKLPSGAGGTNVPASAMIFRQGKPMVAALGANDRVVLRQVTIVRDLGASVEIGGGVRAGDRIIDSPPESLAAGDVVRIATPTAGKPG